MLGTLNPVKWIDDLLPEMLWLGMLNNDHGHRRGIRVAIVTPAVRTHRDDAEDRVPFVKLGKYVLRPRGWRVVAHAPVMPEQRDLYKSEPSKIAIREWPCEARTR